MKWCPDMWLLSESHLSLTLSLGLFLLHILSNPPHPRLSVLVQVGIPQPGEQSNSLTNIFYQSSKLLSNIKACFLKYVLCLYGDIPLYTRYLYLTIGSPSHWQITIIFVLHSTWSQIWLRDQPLFNHLHIRDRVVIHFSAAHPTCVIRSVKWLVRWISRLNLRGVQKWSLWLSMSQWCGI